MNFVLKPNAVLSVARGHDQQQWHVTAQDLTKPLASFNDPQAACAWAIARARPVQGRVLVEEMTGASTPRFDPDAAFRYSIPVMLSGERDALGTAARAPDRKSTVMSTTARSLRADRPA